MDTGVDADLDTVKRLRDAVYFVADWQLELLEQLVARRGCASKSELWRALLYEEGVRAGLITKAAP